MKQAIRDKLYLVAGAFGGEFALMLALPVFGVWFGHAEVALLGVAVASANCGKLVGCLKLDAALTNVDAATIGIAHATAVAAALACSGILAIAVLALTRIAPLPQFVAQSGPALLLVFAGGALQQATTMRLLRENRLAAFALTKALPSYLLVAVVVASRQRLVYAYELAYVATICYGILLHLRWPRQGVVALTRGMLRRAVIERQYLVHGAPASVLDAAVVFSLPIVIILIAGADLAGQAVQLQRITLAPALATSMLLSQHIWRLRFDNNGAGTARDSYRESLRYVAGAGVLSALLALVCVLFVPGIAVKGGLSGSAFGILACLAPLLATYVGSPLTVYFFKCHSVPRYAMLQVALLALLIATNVLGAQLPPAVPRRLLLLVAYGVGSLALTLILSRNAVSNGRERRCAGSPA
jgi:hypothetical protein